MGICNWASTDSFYLKNIYNEFLRQNKTLTLLEITPAQLKLKRINIAKKASGVNKVREKIQQKNQKLKSKCTK